MKRILIILFLGIFLLNFVTASCTVTLGKESYIAGETATATMSCSSATEKSDPYVLNWTFQNGTLVESDTGITPATVSENFYETYTIPTDWPNAIFLNVSLYGTTLTVTQNDSANVSSTAGTNSLVITNATFGGGYIGKVSSISAIVKDENGKKISGGICKITGWNNDETKVLASKESAMFNGIISLEEVLTPEDFNEGTGYAYKIECYCGGNGSATECIDEDGISVLNSVGFIKNTFTTLTWLYVNTLTDKSSYKMKDEVFVCANITNVNYSSRIPMSIYHQVRCSAGTDNNDDLDRVLVASDDSEPDERGINSNTTQNQCKRFILPEANFLQGRNSECYASTNVWVLDDSREKLIGYATTSPVFNLTSTELNIYPDWQRQSDYVFNAIINLSASAYSKYNGTGTGEIDLKLDSVFSTLNSASQYGITGINFENFLLSKYIKNVTVHNSSTQNIDYNVEFLEDGSLEIELPNQDMSSSGWYNVTLELNSFEERQADALEGIENKTGTFHLDVECPSTATLGDDVSCTITAYVEDSQTVQKEVDFTCYISDGVSSYSSINFNQMVTRNAFSIIKNFAVPSTFNSGQQYVLQCHADYYNLGSRRDSFYDTFTAYAIGDSNRGSSSSITGKSVDEGEGQEADEEGGIKDIFEEYYPLGEKGKGIFYFIISIVGLVMILVVARFVVERKMHYHTANKSKEYIDSVLKSLLYIVLIIGVGIILYYIAKFSSNIILNNSLINDSLIKGMILVTFIVLMIIILFKSLNLRGEIKFGGEKRFNEDKKLTKMQNKINRLVLKEELRRLKHKK